jgi:very-short-patch-repair endonuclease
MGTTFNRLEQTSYRRDLRKYGSLAERILWRRVRDRQVRGCKFRRQHGIERYIVDFYCPELMLAIEIGGPHHALQQEEDQLRQKRIEEHGVHFLRFSDEEVINNYERVLEAIAAEIDRLRDSRSATSPGPSSGRRGERK